MSLSIAAILSLSNFNSVSACLSFNGGSSSFALEYTAESEFLRILSPSRLLAASKKKEWNSIVFFILSILNPWALLEMSRFLLAQFVCKTDLQRYASSLMHAVRFEPSE